MRNERMTREELKEHCERQIQQFEQVEIIMPITQESESKRCMELSKSFVQGLRAGLAESEDK